MQRTHAILHTQYTWHRNSGPCMRSKCVDSVLKVRYKHSEPRAAWILKVAQGLLVSICDIFSRFSHGYYGRVERLLKTYKRIAQLCRSLIAIISLLIHRLHEPFYPESCSRSPLVKLCDRLVQISDSLCTTSSKMASM